MAFVPDSAIMAAHQIPAAAFRMYAYFCMRRDQIKGTCYPSLKRTAEDLELKYSYASEMRTLLAKQGWIEMDSENIRPIMGFKASELSETVSDNSELAASEKVEKSFGKSRSKVREKPKQVSTKSELYIEPAQLTSPINQKDKAATNVPQKKIKLPTDERSDHPAIQAIKRIQCRFPDKLFWDDFIEIVGGEPDIPKLIACRKSWRGRGWNQNSTDWVYWYRDGIPEKNSNGKHNSNSPTGKASLTDRAREYNEYYGTGGTPKDAG